MRGGNDDFSVRYTFSELVDLLGEPVSTERFSRQPAGTQHVALVFSCSCRGIPNGDRYEIGSPCPRHGGLNVVRISDRRCGVAALDDLSFDATGLLGLLVGMQNAAERDDEGCVHLVFDGSMVEKYQDAASQLLRANIIRRVLDGSYELQYFTCYDEISREWY